MQRRPSELQVEVQTIALPEPAIDFDLADDHGCAVGSSGRVHCWGDGRIGQLGDGRVHEVDDVPPVEVVGIADALDVEVAPGLSCVLRRSGGLACWGDGRVIPGGGTWAPKRIATDVDGLRVLSPMTCFDSQGSWRCLGRHFNYRGDPLERAEVGGMPWEGRLIGNMLLACTEPRGGVSACGGVRSSDLHWEIDVRLQGVERIAPRWMESYSGIPTKVEGDRITSIVDILANDLDRLDLAIPDMVDGMLAARHGCAILRDGTVQCWTTARWENRGEAGPGANDSPKPVAGIRDAAELALTLRATCVRHRKGRVSCWGTWAELDEAGEAAKPSPPRDMGLEDIVELRSGQGHFCARTKDGVLWCWGSNASGALGVEAIRESREPIVVPGIGKVRDFDMHRAGACVLTDAREVWCWGSDAEFELGGHGRARPLPIAMPDPPIDLP